MFDQFIYVRWEYTAVNAGLSERRPIGALLLDREKLQDEPGVVYTCVLHRDSLASQAGCCGVCQTALERVLYSYQMPTTTIPLVSGEVALTNPPLIDFQALLAPPAAEPEPTPKPKRVRKPKVDTEPAVVLAETDAPTAIINYPS